MAPKTPRKLFAVETTASFARRDGDRVRLVLTLPREETLDAALGGAPGGDRLSLGIRGKSATLRVPVETEQVADGWLLRADADSARLPPGLWGLALRAGREPLGRLQAWLLTSDTQPIALLPGPRPDTLMAPPAPRSHR